MLSPWKKSYDKTQTASGKADITVTTKVHLVKAAAFSVVMYGCESWTIWRLSAEEWMFSNCGAGKDSGQSFGLQGGQTSQSRRQSTLNIHWKDQYWSSSTLATWCEELTHWKRPWCWERLRGGGEGDNRGWDGWMASPTQWTWFWANSRRWWKTGKLGVLQSMELQRVGHNWVNKKSVYWIFKWEN